MKRVDIAPRKDWREKVEELGLIWHTANGNPYWTEAAYYSFTMKQIEEIEKATEDCYEMLLEAGEHVVKNNLFKKFGIPEAFWPLIRKAWEEEPPCLNYGRFDFGYDGINPPKLFEFNCDTPTSLVEASVIQELWKEELFGSKVDQFNSIHEKLVAKWKDIKPYLPEFVHFTHVDESTGEDAVNAAYMADTALEAGIKPVPLLVSDIGWDNIDRLFVDESNHPIEALYKLYPWEWLVNEKFASHIIHSSNWNKTLWIEPIWKMIWSNKAILPILHELYPDHPNLLAARYENPVEFEEDVETTSYVKKPILAREGANIEIIQRGEVLAVSEGDYGAEGFIFQELFPLPNFADKYPVIGSWCVDGFAAGMGIREDNGLITGNGASFIPHVIEG